jgi:hypothetical protein
VGGGTGPGGLYPLRFNCARHPLKDGSSCTQPPNSSYLLRHEWLSFGAFLLTERVPPVLARRSEDKALPTP